MAFGGFSWADDSMVLRSLKGGSVQNSEPYVLEIPNPPTWVSICPAKYVDAEWNEPGRFYSYKEKLNNYWVQRRENFFTEINACFDSKDVAMCYLSVKHNEERKNSEYYQQRAQERAAASKIYGNMAQSLQNAAVQMQQQRPVHCNSYTYGASTSTTCY
jgi:hypothetical protein